MAAEIPRLALGGGGGGAGGERLPAAGEDSAPAATNAGKRPVVGLGFGSSLAAMAAAAAAGKTLVGRFVSERKERGGERAKGKSLLPQARIKKPAARTACRVSSRRGSFSPKPLTFVELSFTNVQDGR